MIRLGVVVFPVFVIGSLRQRFEPIVEIVHPGETEKSGQVPIEEAHPFTDLRDMTMF